jgi:hypothetical protein
MLRTEVQVALHDLLEALREAADLYADDADVLAEGELARLCRELVLRRERLADAVAEEVRRHGDLPSEPDADRETLHRLGNRLRALFSQHDHGVVVRDRLAAESEITRRADRALAVVPEPLSCRLLEEIREDSERARGSLSAFDSL